MQLRTVVNSSGMSQLQVRYKSPAGDWSKWEVVPTIQSDKEYIF